MASFGGLSTQNYGIESFLRIAHPNKLTIGINNSISIFNYEVRRYEEIFISRLLHTLPSYITSALLHQYLPEPRRHTKSIYRATTAKTLAHIESSFEKQMLQSDFLRSSCPSFLLDKCSLRWTLLTFIDCCVVYLCGDVETFFHIQLKSSCHAGVMVVVMADSQGFRSWDRTSLL